jgi:hypothetical protein
MLTYVLWAIPTALIAIFSPFANINNPSPRLPLRWYVVVPAILSLVRVVEMIFKFMAKEYLPIHHNTYGFASDYPPTSIHELLGEASHLIFVVITIFLYLCCVGGKAKKT